MGEVTFLALGTLLGLIPSTIGAFGIGVLFRVKAIWTRILIGFLITSAIGSCFVYFNSSFVRPSILAILIFGFSISTRLFFVSRNKIFTFFRNAKYGVRKHALPVFFCAVTVLLLTYKFLPWFYSYENHDVMYFGWIQSFWIDTSISQVQVPTAWPMQLGSTHTLPGVFIASVASFLPTINLIQAIFIRGLLIIACLLVLLLSLVKKSPTKNFSLFCGVAVFSIIFGQNIGYEFTISSYLYLVILVEILRQALIKFESHTTALLLLIVLPLAKAPLALIAIGTMIYFIFTFRKYINWFVVSFPLLLLGTNFIALFFAPKTIANSDTQFSFIGIKDLYGPANQVFSNDWFESFSGLIGWNVDWVSTSLIPGTFSKESLSFAIFCYTVIAIFGGYITLRIFQVRLHLSGKEELKYFKVIDIYMLLALVSWVGIRNGENLGFGHQAHAYLIASIVPFVLGIFVFQQIISKKIAIFTFASTLVIFSQTGTSLNSRTMNSRWENYPFTTVSAKEPLIVNSVDGIYIPSEKEDLARAQVVASMKGLLMEYVRENDYGKHSQVNNFIKVDK